MNLSLLQSMKKFNVTILTRHSYTLLYFQHQKKGRCSFAIFLLHLLLVLFFFLFSLFPGHLQLSFLRNTIRKIQIYQRLIWNPGTFRLRFKIIDHIPIKIYCYLFFNPLWIRVFPRIQILNIVFFSHFYHPSWYIFFSLFVASLAEIKRITLSSSR